MIIEFISDIHMHNTATPESVDTRPMAGMDFYPYLPKPNGFGEILIIAGDIGPWKYDAEPYLNQMGNESEVPIIFVPGNHEFEMNSPINHRFISPHPNVKVLQFGDTYIKDGYCFIGATLWSHSDKTPKERDTSDLFSDFQSINSPTRIKERLSLDEYVSQHHKECDAVFIACENAFKQGLIPIVITHHAPSFGSTHVSHIGDRFNFLFASDLSERIIGLNDAAPKLWIHGHMHNPVDYYIDKTRIINQPLGYRGEIFAGTSATHWRALDLNCL